MPKEYWLPFFVECISAAALLLSGFRLRRSMDDRGGRVGSLGESQAPGGEMKVHRLEETLASLWVSRRWRNVQIVVSSGTGSLPRSIRAKRRMDSTS
jgi:hypothetical protein